MEGKQYKNSYAQLVGNVLIHMILKQAKKATVKK